MISARRWSGPSAMLFVLCCTGGAQAGWIVASGETEHRIVLGDQATTVERSAAAELVHYLTRSTGADFQIVSETKQREGEHPGIFVGSTRRAAELGLNVAGMPEEAWRIRTDGDDLLLFGGGERGTIYAVLRFLEDHVGVRWWTPFEERVPHRPDLGTPDLDRAGRPVLRYRELTGTGLRWEFHLRSRLNGHRTWIPASHGGREAYGLPDHVHNAYTYVPPETYFETHPEYFSLLDGVRRAEKGQLCLSSAAVLELVKKGLRESIAATRRAAAEKGEKPAVLFNFSYNDWRNLCECEPCKLTERATYNSGTTMFRFVNRLAQDIEQDYPDVLIDTIAYDRTFDPPTEPMRDNVVIRIAPLKHRDFSRPITSKANREYRAAFDGWRKKTKHLRVWGYAVTFGDHSNLPLPNLRVMAEDLRYYVANGVEGVLYQLEYPIRADLRELKMWVLLKLIEDPALDVSALVLEFTEGFYGPAAGPIRAYVSLIEEAAERKPSRIDYPNKPHEYDYLDRRTLHAAHEIFDQAEQMVQDDATLLERVRFARVSLDRATLLRWEDAIAGKPTDLDPDRIAARLQDVVDRRIARVYHEYQREEKRAAFVKEIAEALTEIRKGR